MHVLIYFSLLSINATRWVGVIGLIFFLFFFW